MGKFSYLIFKLVHNILILMIWVWSLVKFLLLFYLLSVKLFKLLKFTIVINLVDFLLIVQLVIHVAYFVFESTVCSDQLFKFVIFLFKRFLNLTECDIFLFPWTVCLVKLLLMFLLYLYLIYAELRDFLFFCHHS